MRDQRLEQAGHRLRLAGEHHVGDAGRHHVGEDLGALLPAALHAGAIGLDRADHHGRQRQPEEDGGGDEDPGAKAGVEPAEERSQGGHPGLVCCGFPPSSQRHLPVGSPSPRTPDSSRRAGEITQRLRDFTPVLPRRRNRCSAAGAWPFGAGPRENGLIPARRCASLAAARAGTVTTGTWRHPACTWGAAQLPPTLGHRLDGEMSPVPVRSAKSPASLAASARLAVLLAASLALGPGRPGTGARSGQGRSSQGRSSPAPPTAFDVPLPPPPVPSDGTVARRRRRAGRALHQLPRRRRRQALRPPRRWSRTTAPPATARRQTEKGKCQSKTATKWSLVKTEPDLCYGCHKRMDQSKSVHTAVRQGSCLSCHEAHVSAYPEARSSCRARSSASSATRSSRCCPRRSATRRWPRGSASTATMPTAATTPT